MTEYISGQSTTAHPEQFALTIAPEEWTKDALCQQADPDAWFPEFGDGRGTLLTREAEKVCASCDVQAQCLAYALKHNINEGIWGGKSPRQRRKMRAA